MEYKVGSKLILKRNQHMSNPAVYEVLDIDNDRNVATLCEENYRWYKLSVAFEALDEEYILLNKDYSYTKECIHEYREYIGFTESYEFCIICDKRK